MPVEECLGGCKEAKERFELHRDCCDSCHEEYDDCGLELINMEVEDGYYHVCCVVEWAYSQTGRKL